MERNYVLDMDKIHAAYIALRNFYNAPSRNDRAELDIYSDAKAVMNFDEIEVFREVVQIAYQQGRNDGYHSALNDEVNI